MKFAIASPQPIFFAQVNPVTTIDGLKTALGSGIGLLVIFAYVAALVIFISGVMKKNNDPTGAADAIKTAAWLAGGTTIVSILFVVFGHSGAVVDAKYN